MLPYFYVFFFERFVELFVGYNFFGSDLQVSLEYLPYYRFYFIEMNFSQTESSPPQQKLGQIMQNILRSKMQQ